MQDYTSLKVWEKSHQFVLEIYRITKLFPNSEIFGLVSQLRRAAVSIPSNIAEGTSRKSKKDFRRFLEIAFGSAKEVDYQLYLSKELGYVSDKEYFLLDQNIKEIKKTDCWTY